MPMHGGSFTFTAGTVNVAAIDVAVLKGNSRISL